MVCSLSKRQFLRMTEGLQLKPIATVARTGPRTPQRQSVLAGHRKAGQKVARSVILEKLVQRLSADVHADGLLFEVHCGCCGLLFEVHGGGCEVHYLFTNSP